MEPNFQEKIKTEIEHALGPAPYVMRSDPMRQRIDGLTPGVIANMDSAGTGPRERVMVGRKVAYLRGPYVEWVLGRMRPAR